MRLATRHLSRVPGAKEAATVVAVFVAAVIASPTTPQGSNVFLDLANLTDALRSLVPVGIAALAMTFVILTGGIDLSVGSILALAGVVTARLLKDVPPSWGVGEAVALPIAAGLLSGAVMGLLNGALIASLRIQPFVVTLATMIGLRGLARWVANNERIGLGLGMDVAGRFGELLSGKAVMVGLWLATAALAWVILQRTVFGRYVRALGDNAAAARLAGLPIAGLQVAVYGISGLLAGLAGILYAARTTSGDPNAGIAFELDVIAVVVIGGASLAGGRGGIFGTLCGALIIGTVTNILGLRNVGANEQLVLKAVIILLSVAAQRGRERA